MTGKRGLQVVRNVDQEDESLDLTDLGENRLRFLAGFSRVKKEMEVYVQICATRLAVTEIPNLLPREHLLQLPTNPAFFTRLFPNGKRTDQIMTIMQEARSFDSSVVCKAIGQATSIVSRLSNSSVVNLEQQGVLMKVFSYIFLAILLLAPSPGPNYQLIRKELLKQKADLSHYQLLQDILALIIDFDKQVEDLLILQNTQKCSNRANRVAKLKTSISKLKESISRTKNDIIEACETLEVQLLTEQYPKNPTDQALLNIALAVQAQDKKTIEEEDDREAMRQAVQEVVNPAASFHEKLARVRVGKSDEGLRELVVDEDEEVGENSLHKIKHL
jgi:hypothetical protein